MLQWLRQPHADLASFFLRMGLAAHGVPVAGAFTPPSRNNMDAALVALAGAERNPLLS